MAKAVQLLTEQLPRSVATVTGDTSALPTYVVDLSAGVRPSLSLSFSLSLFL
jgi:hypothetical protein